MPHLPSSSLFSFSSSKFPKQTEDENELEDEDDSLATHFSDSLSRSGERNRLLSAATIKQLHARFSLVAGPA